MSVRKSDSDRFVKLPIWLAVRASEFAILRRSCSFSPICWIDPGKRTVGRSN